MDNDDKARYDFTASVVRYRHNHNKLENSRAINNFFRMSLLVWCYRKKSNSFSSRGSLKLNCDSRGRGRRVFCGGERVEGGISVRHGRQRRRRRRPDRRRGRRQRSQVLLKTNRV